MGDVVFEDVDHVIQYVADLLEVLGNPTKGPMHVVSLDDEQKCKVLAVASLLKGINDTAVLPSPDNSDDELVFTQFMGSFSAPRESDRGSSHGKQLSAGGDWNQTISGVLRSLKVHQKLFDWRSKRNCVLRPAIEEGQESPKALMEQLQYLHDWDAFDVFKVDLLSNSKPLQTVALAAFTKLSLIDKLNLPLDKLKSFLAEVEAHYPSSNKYHNNIHVADVTQGLTAILCSDNCSQQLTDLEVLALLVASCIHDVNHPGVNNSFLVQSSSEAALLYNDTNVNENSHISLGFKLLLKPENNFMEGLSDVDYRDVRRLIIELILATDMVFHQSLLKTFATSASILGGDISRWKDENRVLLLKFLLHAVDISNPARTWPHCLRWADRVTEEFFCQGEWEREAGVPVSPLNDRETTHPVKNQQVFCDLFVKPTFTALSTVAPSLANVALANCTANSHRYAEMLEMGVVRLPVERLPKEYPEHFSCWEEYRSVGEQSS